MGCPRRAARVGDRGLDLAAVADDPSVLEQALDFPLLEPCDGVGVELGEGGTEGLALAQDRQPREAGLEALEAESLVVAALVSHRPAPLVVVVGLVERIGRRPASRRLR